MYIERVRVEAEGFLSRLDVSFAPGLNVIIGARGTGKTSLIELIRYCLGASAFTEDAATRGRQQAIAILEGGAVSVTLRDGNERFVITRSASGHATSTGNKTARCTVLAQNEVEAVGAQATGRLHLIDRFRPHLNQTASSIATLQAQVRSLTAEVLSLLREMSSIREQASSMSAVSTELSDARQKQQQLLESAQATEDQQRLLLSLQRDGQMLALRESVVNQSEANVEAVFGQLDKLRSEAANMLQPWPELSGDDPLTEARPILRDIDSLLAAAITRLNSLQTTLMSARQVTVQRQAGVDEASRQLRQNLDALQAGIGLTTRRVAELEESQGQLHALQNLLRERQERLDHLSQKRDLVYQALDDLREQVFAERRQVVQDLNAELAPTIRIRINKSENLDAYRSAVVAGLRGSGLHYNALAPMLAQSASPFEVVTWVENGDNRALGSALGITPDRAASVINALRDGGTPDIISSTVEDGIELELLDGHDFKPTDRLSIGQRCTTVLPVLLRHHGDPLIVDQPEDHLDNAFVASTLVSALRGRRINDQFIFSSHNANIPVLGEANQVIVMNSDGDRGYVEQSGALDHPEIVDAVTRVLEGGADAFAMRAAFYRNGMPGSN